MNLLDDFNIPILQAVAVMFIGFFIGLLFLPHFLTKPIRFMIVTGVVFFAIRFLVAYWTNTSTSNGIVNAVLLWLLYCGSITIGYITLKHRWPSPFDVVI